jgi:surface antigen
MGPRMASAFVACIFAMTASAPTSAQRARGWSEILPTMTKEDIRLAQEATREQLTGQPIGTVKVWKNPKSGSSGTVQLVENFKWEDYPCRKVISTINPAKEAPQTWEITICDVNGEWKWPVPPKKR